MKNAGPASWSRGVSVALANAFEGAALLVGVYAADDTLRFASAAFKRLFQLDDVDGSMTFDDLIRRGAMMGCGPRIDSGDVAGFIEDAQRRRRQNPGHRYFVTDTLDGGWYWMTETLLEDGWIVLVGSEISPLKQSELELVEAHHRAVQDAKTDFLTGLPNRRHVFSYLDVAISTLRGPLARLCVALIDLDRFKTINDDYGHMTGDEVLRDFSRLSRTMTRRTDVVGRVGGDEFLIVMPGTTIDEALPVVERLREAVASRSMEGVVGRRVRYSLSAGIAMVSDADTFETALARADVALYESKKSGRNRVCRS